MSTKSTATPSPSRNLFLMPAYGSSIAPSPAPSRFHFSLRDLAHVLVVFVTAFLGAWAITGNALTTSALVAAIASGAIAAFRLISPGFTFDDVIAGAEALHTLDHISPVPAAIAEATVKAAIEAEANPVKPVVIPLPVK